MATHDIDRATWADFFNDFSRRHQGALVTVEAVAPNHGPQAETRALPFVGITFENKESEAGAILLLIGTETGDQVTHTIANPTRVYHKTGTGVLSAEVDPDEALEITTQGDPPITFVRFRPAAG